MTLGDFFAAVNPYITPIGAWLAIALGVRALVKDIRSAPVLEILDVSVAGEPYPREDVQSSITDDAGNLREDAVFVFVPIHIKVRNVGRGPAGRVVVLTQQPSNTEDSYHAGRAQTLLAGDPPMTFSSTMAGIRQPGGTVIYTFATWAIADKGAAVSTRMHSLTSADKMGVALEGQVRWSRSQTKLARWDARLFHLRLQVRRRAQLRRDGHPLHEAMMRREATLRGMRLLV